jgi:hypothetical protein
MAKDATLSRGAGGQATEMSKGSDTSKCCFDAHCQISVKFSIVLRYKFQFV